MLGAQAAPKDHATWCASNSWMKTVLCVCSSETGHVYVTSNPYNCYCGLWIQTASFGAITSEPNKLLCFPVPQHLGEAQTRDDLQSTPNMLAVFKNETQTKGPGGRGVLQSPP